jgi:hypothetical protein
MFGAVTDEPEYYYDGEFYYDAPIRLEKGFMAKIAKNTVKLNAQQLAAKVQVSLTAIAGDATTFPGATAVLALGNTKVGELLDSDALVLSLQAQLDLAREARRMKIAEVDEYYEQELIRFVDNIAKGAANIILAAGMDVAATPGPAPAMPKVATVVLVPGDNDGSAKATYKRVIGARYYELQLSSNPNDPTTWETYDTTVFTTLLLTGQTSGQKRWLRVRAINGVNKGGWSDPACCTIP